MKTDKINGYKGALTFAWGLSGVVLLVAASLFLKANLKGSRPESQDREVSNLRSLLAVPVQALQLMDVARNRGTMSPDVRAQQVVEALESCPAWSDAKADASEILNRLIPLSKLDTGVLREGVENFVRKCRSQNTYDIGNMSKLFVLNRILFAVPVKEQFGGPFFGGWEGVPHDEHEMNMMWPLSPGKDGQLQLTSKYAGYSGDRYLAVQEFDHFLWKHGRRQIGPTTGQKSKQVGVPYKR